MTDHLAVASWVGTGLACLGAAPFLEEGGWQAALMGTGFVATGVVMGVWKATVQEVAARREPPATQPLPRRAPQAHAQAGFRDSGEPRSYSFTKFDVPPREPRQRHVRPPEPKR